jgi:predicted nucleotidyltransferase
MNITEHETFKACNGKLIINIVAGSNLYGLNTPTSDIDYRGLFVATDPKYLANLNTIESIVQDGEVDATYYELTRYLKLLRKSNTQVLEILFAPESSFVYKHPHFDVIRNNKYSLIETAVLKNSLKGYVYSELKLATGQRSGQLGGKRKQAVTTYGYSPKNFIQILRLCRVGIQFFTDGQYMVNVKEFNPEYHKLLMDIKTCPEKYERDQLEQMVNDEFFKLEKVIDNTDVEYKFDDELAAQIILDGRKHFVD